MHGKYSSTWFGNFLMCWSGPNLQPSPHSWEYNDPAELLQLFGFATISDGAQKWTLPLFLAPQGEPVLAQPQLLLQHRLECRGKQEDLASLWVPLWCPTNLPLTSPDTSAHCHGSCEMEELCCIHRSDTSFALEQFSHGSICVNPIFLFPLHRALFFSSRF